MFFPSSAYFRIVRYWHFNLLSSCQHGRLSNCVLSAGADSSRLLSVPAHAVLAAEGSIVIAPGQEEDVDAGLATTIAETLQENQQRMIPESEIGYSILYVSTSQYCNPTVETGEFLECMKCCGGLPFALP